MTPEGTVACARCRQTVPAESVDRLHWCEECRRAVIRRSSLWARGISLGATLALVIWIVLAIGPSQRFLLAWMAIIGAFYYFLFKLTRRVAFEIISGRMTGRDGAG